MLFFLKNNYFINKRGYIMRRLIKISNKKIDMGNLNNNKYCIMLIKNNYNLNNDKLDNNNIKEECCYVDDTKSIIAKLFLYNTHDNLYKGIIVATQLQKNNNEYYSSGRYDTDFLNPNSETTKEQLKNDMINIINVFNNIYTFWKKYIL